MIPPLIGFFAKQQVLLTSMQSGYYLGPIIAIFTSVIGASYYLRIIKFLYFCNSFLVPSYIDQNNNRDVVENLGNVFSVEEKDPNINIAIIPSNHLSLVIAILTCGILFFILKPFLLLNVINMVTLSLS
jgi:NADH:ubiquinone oxidoreductase subunit 2 (subunit N)